MAFGDLMWPPVDVGSGDLDAVIIEALGSDRMLVVQAVAGQHRYYLTTDRSSHADQPFFETGVAPSLAAAAALCEEFVGTGADIDGLSTERAVRWRHTPRAAADRSLLGLAVGDALGKTWSTWSDNASGLAERRVPPGPWTYTDDTVMAAAVLTTLRRYGRIVRDHLAADFARRFEAEPERGYGAGAFWLLSQLARGRDWRQVSTELFRGGSFGNGSAMRVAPLGAFFFDDLDRAVAESAASAEVTHAHPEGQAGAIAVAVAAAHCAGMYAFDDWFDEILARAPDGDVRRGIARAAELGDVQPEAAAQILGDGREVTCRDTVPFALWCARPRSHAVDFESAMFDALGGCASAEADRDTICAIVGGIVGARSEPPPSWRDALEPLADLN
jgi:ADP-ribosylglycohydrolase